MAETNDGNFINLWLSLESGLMIGASAVLLMATNGHIAGISGLTSRISTPFSKGAI